MIMIPHVCSTVKDGYFVAVCGEDYVELGEFARKPDGVGPERVLCDRKERAMDGCSRRNDRSHDTGMAAPRTVTRDRSPLGHRAYLA